jgi:endonuclease-8
VPEGDTLARIASALSPVLNGKLITAARGRPGGVQLERVVGQRVETVESRGKHLLIGFDGGLTLHTHLGMHGSWHRYRSNEKWRRAPSRAVAVLATHDWVAVCFDAPTVELMDSRAVSVHPALRGLGPDVASESLDVDAAIAALRLPERGQMAIGDALLDQRAVAGFGNVYRSELCFLETISPFTLVSAVSDDTLRQLIERGSALVRLNSGGGERVTTTAGTPGNTYVYGRAGRPCRRCGTRVTSTTSRGREGGPPRRVYWCPTCQPAPASAPASASPPASAREQAPGR